MALEQGTSEKKVNISGLINANKKNKNKQKSAEVERKNQSSEVSDKEIEDEKEITPKNIKGKPRKSAAPVFGDMGKKDLEKVKSAINERSKLEEKNSLSPSRLAQLHVLSSFANDDGEFTLSHSKIMDIFGIKNRKNISKLLDDLCKKQKIELVAPYNSAKATPATYKICKE